jgi:hypothetical protein
MLARAMPDVLLWLGACAVLGTLNGGARLVMLFRFHARRQTHVVRRSK